MKKIIAILLAVMMLLSVVGCTTEGNNNSDSTETNETPSTNTGNNNTNDDQTITTVTESVVRSHKVADDSLFTYSDVAGGVRITAYKGTDDIVVIPNELSGKSVVAVDALLFGNNSKVRGVLLPESVTELIGTFTNNTSIEVVICEGVEIVGDNTFNSCTSLHTVILGDKLKELGNSAFFSCTKLKELYIAPSLTEINSDYATTVFFWCDELTIYGVSGSYIEGFCSNNNIAFKVK